MRAWEPTTGITRCVTITGARPSRSLLRSVFATIHRPARCNRCNSVEGQRGRGSCRGEQQEQQSPNSRGLSVRHKTDDPTPPLELIHRTNIFRQWLGPHQTDTLVDARPEASHLRALARVPLQALHTEISIAGSTLRHPFPNAHWSVDPPRSWKSREERPEERAAHTRNSCCPLSDAVHLPSASPLLPSTHPVELPRSVGLRF